MLPVVSIVGHSRSGKTTLIERLIGELSRRGLRIAVVKHTGGSFDMDRPGKDTWRYARAGCESVAIVGHQGSALLRSGGGADRLDEVLQATGGDADLVLVEGLHGAPTPKIEVHRAELGRELRCRGEDLLAVVTDEPLNVGCQEFGPEEIEAIATLLEKEIACPGPGGAALKVNGRPVPLGSFTQRLLATTVLGLVSSLKGVGEIRTLSLELRGVPGQEGWGEEPSGD